MNSWHTNWKTIKLHSVYVHTKWETKSYVKVTNTEFMTRKGTNILFLTRQNECRASYVNH